MWAYILLDRTPDWLPWLRWVVLVAGVAAAGLVLAGPGRSARPGAAVDRGESRRARLALAAAPLGLALVAGLAGPAAYALDTVGTAHTGAIPSAGPASAGFGGGPGGGPGGQGGFPGAGQSGRGRPEPGRPEEPGRRDRAPNGTERRRDRSRRHGPLAEAGPGGIGAWRDAAPGGAGTGGMPRGGAGRPGRRLRRRAAGWAATPR